MTTARAGATSTTLPNGDVLVVGGNHNGSLSSAEVYGISDCAIICPFDVTSQTGSVTATGTIVNYTAPTTTGTCGTVACDPPSGSFFLVGTTSVSCTAGFGAECSFDVTVVNNPPPTITGVEYVKTDGGAKPRLVVRGTAFQPGANGSDRRRRIRCGGYGRQCAHDAHPDRETDRRPHDQEGAPETNAGTVTVTNLDGGTVSTSYTR